MKYATELFGTFVLVFAGLGTAVLAGSQVGNLGVALAFGLALMAMAFAIGPISGCHINPAVTFGVLLSGRIGVVQALGYWVSQFAGGILGAGLVMTIANGANNGLTSGVTALAGAAVGYGPHSPGHFTLLSCFLAEAFLTMLLVVTVLGATDKRAPAGFAGIPIGLILSATILAGIPVTNAAINPARALASAFWVRGWALEQVWLFIVAPLVGGAMAAIIYAVLGKSETK
jgi:aquaporin Z